MKETEMSNRGSKSAVRLLPAAVKEQRVDGSLCKGSIINRLHIRCTLMGFEKNYQIKILSKQIRPYTTHKNLSLTKKTLNPWFITGFTEAEGSFIILVLANNYASRWRVKANFAIKLNKKDLALLEAIKDSLGVGKIYISGDFAYYRVEAFKDLEVIIRHFDTYPLITVKKVDYMLFKQAFMLIRQRKHLTKKGLLEIVRIKSYLNKGLPDLLKKEFKVYNELDDKKADFKFDGIKDPNWVAGFTSGDGSFNIKTTETREGKVQLRYAVDLHIREKDVIIGLYNYLITYGKEHSTVAGCHITQETSKLEHAVPIYIHEESVEVQIVNFSDIIGIIIPFFETYEIQGQKKLDFLDFKRVADMVAKKQHLSGQGYKEILQIKQKMNLNRKV